jgi:hypothetical protein
VAIVLMVKGNNPAADLAPPELPDAFDAHEVIVADSIDEAVAASSRRAPDLILVPAALLANGGRAMLAGMMGRAHETSSRKRRGRRADPPSTQWLYWFATGDGTHGRASAACEFLERARQCLAPADKRTT